jgi:hypothetical protein
MYFRRRRKPGRDPGLILPLTGAFFPTAGSAFSSDQ